MSCFYTNQQLLPQSQSPEQLSAWLAGKHPGYDLVAWCFYGNVISQPTEGEHPNVDAVAYITQFVQSPTTPHLGGIGIRPFQSSFSYAGGKTDGYLLSGDVSPFPNPSLTVTPNPWSVVTSYSQFSQQSTNCISLLEGEFGSKGAKYMLTADALCLSATNNRQRLRAEIKIEDAMGVVAVGYGPSSYSPQMLTPQQVEDIRERHDDIIAKYLEKTNSPMTDQGSYYYSAPLLEVKSFKITKEDGTVFSEGNQGTLWMDYVVQNYQKRSSRLGSARWQWFAIQFPDKGEALAVSQVEVSDPSSVTPLAMHYSTTTSKKMANGALLTKKQWKMSEISITPDLNSVWTSPYSGQTYYMKYNITLGPFDSPDVQLAVEAVRDDQEVYLNVRGVHVAKYEGVFNVSGTINGEPYRGYAWGEICSNAATNSGNSSNCCALV